VDGDFLSYGDADNYIQRVGANLDIKATTGELAFNNALLSSADGGKLEIGTVLNANGNTNTGSFSGFDFDGDKLSATGLDIIGGANPMLNFDENLFISPSDGLSLRAANIIVGETTSPNYVKWIDQNDDTSVVLSGNNLGSFSVAINDGGNLQTNLSVNENFTQMRGGIRVIGSQADVQIFLPVLDPSQDGKWYVDPNGFVKVSSGGTAPSSPVGLDLCRQPSGLEFSWSAVSGADEYEIQRSIDGASFTSYTTTTGTSILDGAPAIDADGDYQYRVRACNSVGCSSYSTSSTTTYNTATVC
jgi:hypothetical protein